MKIGYARVSTTDQNLDRQIDQLTKEGCERIYQEKSTGTNMDRIELGKMLDAMRCGDTIIVAELTRLSRSVKDLFVLVDRLNKECVNIKSLKEPWLDTTTPHGRLLFSIFSGISQFERDLIQERTLEGIRIARARGIKGGRPKVEDKVIRNALKMYDDKVCSVSEIIKIFGISRSTLYSYIRERKN